MEEGCRRKRCGGDEIPNSNSSLAAYIPEFQIARSRRSLLDSRRKDERENGETLVLAEFHGPSARRFSDSAESAEFRADRRLLVVWRGEGRGGDHPHVFFFSSGIILHPLLTNYYVITPTTTMRRRVEV